MIMAIQGIETGAFLDTGGFGVKAHAFAQSPFYARDVNQIPVSNQFGFTGPPQVLTSQLLSKNSGTDSIPQYSGKYVFMPYFANATVALTVENFIYQFLPGAAYQLLRHQPALDFMGNTVGNNPNNLDGFVYAALWGGDVSMKIILRSLLLPGTYVGSFVENVQQSFSLSPWPSSCTCQIISQDSAQMIDVTPPGAGVTPNVITNFTIDTNALFGRRTNWFAQITQATRPDPRLSNFRTVNNDAATFYAPGWNMTRTIPG